MTLHEGLHPECRWCGHASESCRTPDVCMVSVLPVRSSCVASWLSNMNRCVLCCFHCRVTKSNGGWDCLLVFCSVSSPLNLNDSLGFSSQSHYSPGCMFFCTQLQCHPIYSQKALTSEAEVWNIPRVTGSNYWSRFLTGFHWSVSLVL